MNIFMYYTAAATNTGKIRIIILTIIILKLVHE